MNIRKLFLPVLVVIAAIFVSSCGTNLAITTNNNLNTTHVQLAQENYRVVDSLKGSASVPYIFFIGGLNRKHLYGNAYSSMMKKANLMEGSRAVVNIFTEEHIGGVFPFYYERTVTVSGYVIEFTE